MHSAPSSVVAEPESAPDQPVIQSEFSPGPPGNGAPRSRLRLWMLGVTVAIVAAAILFVATRSKSSSNPNQASSGSSTPVQGLRLKGTTEAVQSRAILAPTLAGQSEGTLTIIHLTAAGTRVKKGGILVEFDRQAQMRDYVDKQADYAKLVDQVAEEQAKESAARAKDETELKTAEDALRKAELEIQKAEIVSRIDAEKNQETLDEAKATFAQLKETFELKRRAAQAAIHILEIQRDRTKETMLHAQANADLMQIRSPLDGVVVLNSIWKQGTMAEVQEGDQVRPGTSFMQVVNPEAMQVRIAANQQDFPKLQIGQTAKIHLDAYPDLQFRGSVEQLAPIGEEGSFSNKVRVFSVVVSIRGNDPKLMPDLSAAVDVDLSDQRADQTSAAGSGSGS
jgi:HlyD family secretion protein